MATTKKAVLDAAIAQYVSQGWILISRTGNLAQLRKPKQFNWFWFLFWVVISFMIIGGLGLLYLIYYFVKKEQIVSLSVNDAGELLTNGSQQSPGQPTVTVPTRPMTPEEQEKAKKSNQKVLIIVGAAVVLLILAAVICQSSSNNAPAASLHALSLLI